MISCNSLNINCYDFSSKAISEFDEIIAVWIELVIDAKDDNRAPFLDEAADLMYQFLVLLAGKGVDLSEVEGL